LPGRQAAGIKRFFTGVVDVNYSPAPLPDVATHLINFILGHDTKIQRILSLRRRFVGGGKIALGPWNGEDKFK
jgi:hypothetical protein